MAYFTIDDLTPRAIARFYRLQQKGAPDACWPWLGTKIRQGYGCFRLKIGPEWKTVKAYHLSLVLAGLPRQLEYDALHSCDNPSCVNPTHLRWGTHAENMAEMAAKDRTPRGVERKCSVLTDELVRAIRIDKRNNCVVARELGICHSTVRSARLRLTWSHIE